MKTKIIVLSTIADSCEYYNYVQRVNVFLHDLNNEYPRHLEWFAKVADSIIRKNDRDIIICLVENEIAGVSIIKFSANEKKICTLRVSSKYSRLGIGSMLLELSCSILGTDKPLITVSSKNIGQFSHLFDKYAFSLEHVYDNKYKKGISEYSYNGVLLQSTLLTDDQNPSIISYDGLMLPKRIFVPKLHISNTLVSVI